jgi:hypothetical protein
MPESPAVDDKAEAPSPLSIKRRKTERRNPVFRWRLKLDLSVDNNFILEKCPY